jgi:putative FmdB family regulatory protein
MPLYDYQCDACGQVFEVRATIREKEAGLVLECPGCGSHEAHQLLSAAWTLHGSRGVAQPVCDPNAGSCCCG